MALFFTKKSRFVFFFFYSREIVCNHLKASNPDCCSWVTTSMSTWPIPVSSAIQSTRWIVRGTVQELSFFTFAIDSWERLLPWSNHHVLYIFIGAGRGAESEARWYPLLDGSRRKVAGTAAVRVPGLDRVIDSALERAPAAVSRFPSTVTNNRRRLE